MGNVITLKQRVVLILGRGGAVVRIHLGAGRVIRRDGVVLQRGVLNTKSGNVGAVDRRSHHQGLRRPRRLPARRELLIIHVNIPVYSGARKEHPVILVG